MFHYYLKAFNKTFTLGRSRRSEYWYFLYVYILILLALALIGLFSFIPVDKIWNIYNLLVSIPYLTLSIRRLHDIDKSGWFLLIGLIPIVGFLYLTYLFCIKGDIGDNQYGPDPKHED